MPLKKVKTLFSTKHKLEILVLCKWTVGYFINLLSEDSTSYLAGGGGAGEEHYDVDNDDEITKTKISNHRPSH